MTGTEVLSGRVRDANGPWLADRLTELGVDHATTVVVGDRPQDMRAALEWLRSQGLALVITSGGLGPTADDLTAEVVADFHGRPLALDEALEGRIAAKLEPLLARFPNLDVGRLAGGHAQAGAGAVGRDRSRAGRDRAGARRAGHADRRRAARPAARAAGDVARRGAGAGAAGGHRGRGVLRRPDAADVRHARVRDRGDAARRRAAGDRPRRPGDHDVPAPRRDRGGHPLRRPTRRTSTRRSRTSSASATRRRCSPTTAARSTTSSRGRCCDRGETIATAESCTGGLLAARLTERAGSSDYVLGGIVAYANSAKVASRRGRPGAHHAPRRRVGGGRGGARRSARCGASTRTSAWASRASPGRAGAPRPSRSGSSACRSQRATAGASRGP